MNIAIIPARGGSKRIPKKNIKEFCGKPMIAWSIELAISSELFDDVIVSTDDDDIADDYVDTLLSSIVSLKGNFDVLTFKTAHYIDGVYNRDVVYSTTKGNKDRADYYIRWANAICCWRVDFAKMIGYGQVTFGEDSDFGSRANKKRPKEVFINKVLYKHLWSSELSTGEVVNEGKYKLTYGFPKPEHTEHLVIHSIT